MANPNPIYKCKSNIDLPRALLLSRRCPQADKLVRDLIPNRFCLVLAREGDDSAVEIMGNPAGMFRRAWGRAPVPVSYTDTS